MTFRPPLKPLAVALLGLTLAACNDPERQFSNVDLDDPANDTPDFQLQLLHLADMDGSDTDALANVGHMSALVSAFTAQYPDNTLFLSSGDNYIPGGRYTAAGDASFSTVTGVATPGEGRADIAFLNAMGLQASAVGNHDLDNGPADFAALISADTNWEGAQFPYLSSNLDFSVDADLAARVTADGQEASSIPTLLAGTAIITVDGEEIGIVGATTPELENITSTGDIDVQPANNRILDLASNIQASVDALTATGIDKVILLAHMQQINIEQQLATLLDGVDIIVAGGSNTLLADSTDRLRDGDSVEGSYPLAFSSISDEPVLVVNTDGDYKYLGRLVISFNSDGVIIPSTQNITNSGAYATDDTSVTEAGGTVDSTVAGIVDAVNDVLIAQEGNILGNTAVYLNGSRGSVRTEETNLGNLTADANLWYARLYDPTVAIAIKNGGGIRADIGDFTFPPGSTDVSELIYTPPAAVPVAGKEEGDISQFDIETTLRFNNGLTIITITHQELKNILETGVAEVENVGGQFAQVAGLTFEYDPTGTPQVDDGAGNITTAGTRVRNVSVDGTPVISNGVVLSPAATLKAVSLGFLVGAGNEPGGGDGYLAGVDITAGEREDLVAGEPDAVDMSADDPGNASFAETGSEQDALAEYLQEFHPDADSAFDQPDTIADVTVSDTRIIAL